MMIEKDAIMSDRERNHPEQRPPIVLTALDRERLFALLGDALTTVDKETACFLREEIVARISRQMMSRQIRSSDSVVT